MPATTEYYKYSALATASYVRMGGGPYTGAKLAGLAPTQADGRLPTALAQYLFAPTPQRPNPNPWTVLSYYGGDIPASVDPNAAADKSGFGATLFSRTENGQTEKVLALRGTEPLEDGIVDLLSADLGQIGILGLALTQVVSMANYVARLRETSGVFVRQLRVEARTVQPGANERYVEAAGSSLDTPKVYFVLTDTSPLAGLGAQAPLILPGERVRLTGHSLGGHLTYMAARLFPEVFDPQMVVFNAAGYDPDTTNLVGLIDSFTQAAQIFKSNLAKEVGVAANFLDTRANQLTDKNDAKVLRLIRDGLYGDYGFTQGVPKVVSLRSEDLAPGDDASFVASRFTGAEKYGTAIDIPTEHNNHTIEALMDALSLQAAIEPMQGTLFGSNDLIRVLEASAKDRVRSYEGLAEALYRLFLGKELALPKSDESSPGLLPYVGKGAIEARNAFHDAVLQIQEALKSQPGLTILSLADLPADALKDLAADGDVGAKEYRYALRNLNPFAVLGPDSLYDVPRQAGVAAHNAKGELNLFVDAASTPAGMTSEYLTDRAQMLAFLMTGNTNDTRAFASNQVSDQVLYQDLVKRPDATSLQGKPTELNVFLTGGTPNPRGLNTRVISFGIDSSDVLQGRDNTDRLYGGTGADVLTGAKANDYLEGGAGMDVYAYSAETSILSPNTNDGDDELRDTDGKGVLRYTFTGSGNSGTRSRVIGGAALKVTPTQWQSPDEKFVYDRQGPDLRVTISGDAGGSMLIRDFNFAKAEDGGYLGIHFVDPLSAPDSLARTFHGDKQDWDSDPAQGGVQIQTDAYGNNVRADGQESRPDLPQTDRADTFYGSSVDEAEKFATAGGDDVVYGDGPSSFTSSLGGRDLVETGAGRDIVTAGAGNDWVEGGSGGDVLGGNPGNDTLFGDSSAGQTWTLAQAIGFGETGVQAAGPGDLLTGDAGNDVVVGAATADLIYGGEGADVIAGGAGADNIYGDGTVTAATLDWQATRTITVSGSVRNYVLSTFGVVVSNAPDIGSADAIYGGAGADWLFAGAGDDYVEGGNSAGDANVDDDVLFGEAGSDIVIGGSGKDSLHGDSASVDAAGLSGDDYLDGGAGDDELLGYKGDDILIGGEGADTLVGGEGDDLVWGGPGDDIILRGSGKDGFIYHRGDGKDEVRDPDIASGADYLNSLVLGPGITKSEVKFRLGSLVVDLGGGDEIHFEGFDPGNPLATPVLGSIQFADGQVMTYQEILAQGITIDGTEGDDSEASLIEGTEIRDLIDAKAGNDVVFARGGDDEVLGGAGDDVLDGGGGNDTLAGGEGIDTYVFQGRSGIDAVTDGEGGETNVVRLGAGLTLDNIAATREGDALRISLRGLSDALVIQDYNTRAQGWIVRDEAGTDTALEDLIGRPDPYAGDFVGRLWADAKLGHVADVIGLMVNEIGWKPLGGLTFQSLAETAWLHSTSQTTIETFTRVNPPHEVLASNVTLTSEHELDGFGILNVPLFRWFQTVFETGRQESDAAVISGLPITLPQEQYPGQQALLTLKYDPQLFNVQHIQSSASGGVVSYDTGTETLLANVTYEYDIRHYNRTGYVVDVDASPGPWGPPLNAVDGNRVLVNMTQVVDRFRLVNEIVAGDSANLIFTGHAGNFIFTMKTLVDAGGGDDQVFGTGLLYGNSGADRMEGSGSVFIGGDGNDELIGRDGSRFVYLASEAGIDRISETSEYEQAYLGRFYGNLGIANWEYRAEHGGEYAVAVGEGGLDHFDTYEEAFAAHPQSEITFVEPLPAAPAVRREDTAALDSLIQAGVMPRDTVQFGPGLGLADLDLTVTVPGFVADEHPEQPWYGGGTLSVRWGSAGFDLEVPASNAYRVGEGIESFDFAGGTRHFLATILEAAAVIPRYHHEFRRGSGEQIIDPRSPEVVFEPGIEVADVAITRQGVDLVLRLNDFSASGRIEGWFADPANMPGIGLRFADGASISTQEATAIALTQRGSPFDDILQSIDGFANRLHGMGGNDVLNGANGEDVLEGGEGDDQLDGGADKDTYVFNRGDAVDTVSDASSGAEASVIVFGPDVHPGQIQLGLGSLVVNYGLGDAIHFSVFDPDDPYAAPAFERLEFDDGSSLSYQEVLDLGFQFLGTEGDDVIIATGLRDFMAGGEGSDTYIYALGDGYDQIADWDEALDDVDTLQLTGGILPLDVRVTRDDWSYHLVFGATDRLVLDSAAREPYAEIERIEFDDGTLWTQVDLAALVMLLPGTERGDALWGSAGDDTLEGLGGDDSLFGNAGEDFLAGGEGGDFYYFAAGDGADVVDNADTDGSFDSIFFADASSTDAKLARSGDDLVIRIGGGSDRVTLAGWYSDPQRKIDDVSFAGDSVFWDAATLEALAPLEGGNSAPEPAKAIADQEASEDAAFSFTVPADAFSDPDADDMLAYSAGALPEWLSFDAGTRTFSGTPENADVDAFEITVTATDTSGKSASDAFSIKVLNTNDAPIVGTALLDQPGREGELFSFALPSHAFADVDAGDSLALEATLADGAALPGWLAFENGTFSGTPGLADGGEYQIEVTATDSAGVSAAASFGLTVSDSLARGDRLIGTRRNDVLNGTSAAELLDGRGGNDRLSGGAGKDLYIHELRGGHDTIDEAGAAGEPDVLRFGEGITRHMVRAKRHRDDLVLDLSGPHGSVTVKDWFGSSAQRVERIEFADGTDWDEKVIRKAVRLGDDHDCQEPARHDDHRDERRDRLADERGSHRDDRPVQEGAAAISERLSRSLAFDFEALARELERSGKQEEALTPQQIQRQWAAVQRYVSALALEGEESDADLGGWRDFSAANLLGASGFGFEASVGAARGPENLKSLEGLSEGFRRL